jgi:hypothetical protein
MEKDVVCGMQVDPAKAARTSQYQGNTYYFCSTPAKASSTLIRSVHEVTPEPGPTPSRSEQRVDPCFSIDRWLASRGCFWSLD